MAELDHFSNVTNDEQPIAIRRSRRSSVGPPARLGDTSQTTIRHSILTPPSTPKRVKKRVRFSDPGPEIQLESASSGLTPFIRRASISSIPTTRRHSTPSTLSNRAEYDTTPISGTLQFAPLRQVLDGRVKRRLRRHRLSEEINVIEWEKRHDARERKSEVARLREELAAKDLEVQSMRDEHDIASQLEGESGGSFATSDTLSTKVQELEQEIQDLKAQLHRRESEEPDDVDWDMAARDPYDNNFDDDDDDDNMITNYDDDFTMNDEIMTTPARLNTSFPSPPSTLPNTPCRSTSSVSAGIQASLPISDPENQQLKAQLKSLQEEIDKLNSAIAFNTDHQDRLTAKLGDFLSRSVSVSHDASQDPDHTTFDAALDRVLTTLALSQSASLEHQTTFSALSTEISSLGFGNSTPYETIQLISSQFRQARLDLEYLSPGETSFGFENDKLLGMLVDRVKVLTQKVKEGDEAIDQYHEQEVLLRQQLGTRVDAMDDLRDQLKLADQVVSSLREESKDKDVDNERLREALDGYRTEVKGLEDLIERIERENVLKEEGLHSEISELEQRLQHEVMRSEGLVEDSESKDAITVELQRRLSTALQAAAQVQQQLDDLTSSHTAGEAEKDIRIAELGISIIEKINSALKNAHATILTLRNENHGLNFELRAEREKGQVAVKAMLDIMGYPMTTAGGPTAESSSPVKGGLITPMSGGVVRRSGGMFDGGLARRGSNKGKKRRRYDSGLGFLSEGEEVDGVGEFSSDL
ncbi:uncharacterized protein LY89DRAFT_655723 [Mollisia scopiformis]|uniref:Uncharacterized protein n=1 Tax=Mollisia scopiformis TaxID=149040 RepID=A0A194WT85_MOLSC|nr:uncharacterized protein LY89DRAFT_655723 [Mollisia scopiformis]KUJ10889.1 hypothetical protein LY89DRAFT_655723 [Mollisia scopiformis]